MTDDKKRRQRRCPVQECSMYFGSLKEAVCCTSYKDIFPFLCFVCSFFFVIFASLPLLCGSSLIVVISLQIKRFFSNVTFPVADRDTEAENQKQAFKLFFSDERSETVLFQERILFLKLTRRDVWTITFYSPFWLSSVFRTRVTLVQRGYSFATMISLAFEMFSNKRRQF